MTKECVEKDSNPYLNGIAIEYVNRAPNIESSHPVKKLWSVNQMIEKGNLVKYSEIKFNNHLF